MMEIIRGEQHRLPVMRGSVISIGNYDGVHRGHQELIRRLKGQAKNFSAVSTVMMFEPYPQEYFQPNNLLARLTTFRQKVELLRDCGVDRIVCVRFDRSLAETKPEDFVESCLVGRLGVQHVVVGEGFRFGKDRVGSVELLQELAKPYGFGVTEVATICIDGDRVSSSQIRKLLAEGDLDGSRKLLGRRFSISGHVSHGDRRGRAWGFPTANVFPAYDHLPLRGVFAVLVTGIGGRRLQGVANLGTRPTVAGTRLLLEVHCFDFDQDIYSQRIQIEFCHRIRGEKQFSGPKQLRLQIQKDVDQVRNWFQMSFTA